MALYSFHLARIAPWATLGALLRPPSPARTPGLVHAECMTRMTLGSGVLSPRRAQLRHLVMFAAWDDDASLDDFLADDPLGRRLARGWHLRMRYLHRWGSLEALNETLEGEAPAEHEGPVAAVTVARMRLLEVPRFLRWGRPVERQVRDDPHQRLACAAIRLPRTICTFSIWENTAAMRAMVEGHAKAPDPKRHVSAMVERRRRPFHFEFTTLRFVVENEVGEWEGRRNICAPAALPPPSP